MLVGPGRWETADGSIFSVADGRRLAQEPVRLPTAFEAARQHKIERAAIETPLVRSPRVFQGMFRVCINQSLERSSCDCLLSTTYLMTSYLYYTRN